MSFLALRLSPGPLLMWFLTGLSAVMVLADEPAASRDANSAKAVVISRDEWGVAHVHGKTHADAFFGMGYAHAEDYFWQLEDTCIQSVGRYAEVVGEVGL